MQNNDKKTVKIIAALHKEYCKKYDSKATACGFLKSLAGRKTYDFELQTIYNELLAEFSRNNQKCISLSKQNWRFEKQTKMNPKNDSLEKVLEKMVVTPSENIQWVNQVPVASGVFTSRGDGKRAIDLVSRISEGTYEFVELKTMSNNPVYAAFEILLYGILYIFYRKNVLSQNKEDAKKEILKAKAVCLVVAAPHAYFTGYEHLGTLQSLLSSQLLSWASKTSEKCSMSFRFDSFEFNDPKTVIAKNVNKFLDKKPYC